MPESSGSEGEDQSNLSRAYNQSIYLMLAVPYTMVGVVGYMVYRQLQARAALMEASFPPGPEPLPRAPGADTCPTTRPDVPL